MNTSCKYILIIMAFVASIFTAAATDDKPQPQQNRRLLRLPNDTNHRILESSSMSMATESMDIDDIVSKLKTQGEVVDPANMMLALTSSH